MEVGGSQRVGEHAVTLIYRYLENRSFTLATLVLVTIFRSCQKRIVIELISGAIHDGNLELQVVSNVQK